MAIARDQALHDTQTKFMSDFGQVASDFVKYSNLAIPKLIEQESSDLTNIQQMFTIAETVTTQLDLLVESMSNFQASRTSCITTIVRLQAAVWCLACDPNYASKGVSAGPTLTISDDLCDTIESSCYNYISLGAYQSLLLQFRALLTVFQRINTALYKIANGAVSVTINLEPPSMPADDAMKPTIITDDCTDVNNCGWSCTNFIKVTGMLDERALGNGGLFGNYLMTGSRRLTGEDNNVRVLTSSSGWNPDLDEAGVDVSFNDNPASLYGSRVKGFIFMSLFGLWMVLLF